jgi:hypothetical protein
LKDEDDIEGFLGIQIDCTITPDGSVTITMTQPGLIDQILEDIGLVGDQVTQKCTPAMHILQLNPNVAPFNDNWNYWSIIGKLNFLTHNTRPDISMALFICVRGLLINRTGFTKMQ